MTKEDQILAELSAIIDPDLNKDIVSLGFIKELLISDEDNVSFKIELTTPACPIKDEFKRQAMKLVSDLDWVKDVDVVMDAIKPKSKQNSSLKGLSKVTHILAVSSCKGGVGKSTVAVNLAYSLSQSGAKVGIFDADVYGPSLSTMVKTRHQKLVMTDDLIEPLMSHNVKLMSFAYTQGPETGAAPAILRGPMVTQIIQQLLTGTNWGELDYLIIDMPPGTGDVQLTLGQIIPLTAAVIVTTPQHISFIDVVKGINMFDTLKVPTIAVVENMSYFLCSSCNKKHRLFGEGALKTLVEEYGFKNTYEIPLDDALSPIADLGRPFILDKPNSTVSKMISALSESVVRELSKLKFGQGGPPNVGFDAKEGVLIKPKDDQGFSISSRELRLACRCAHCQEEFTGKSMISEKTIPIDVHPLSMNPVGNYALGINWSDGHSSLFPYEVLTNLGKEKVS